MTDRIRSGASVRQGFFFLLLAVAGAALSTPGFRAMHRPDPILPGPGVTSERRLAEWLPGLSGGPGDTPVFVLEGGEPGGTALVVGGTHGDEAAGFLAATVLVEAARVSRGRLLVIPRANASGFTHNIGQEAHPSGFVVETPGGPRRFTFGARATNPVHQWPDPQVYTHVPSGQTLSGSETRNLNRAYPGRADGSLTERIAFAVTALLRKEGVDLAVDLHEASPEYPVVNTIVAHERAMEIAALANVNLQATGIAIGLESSPPNLHGLSHREWGDATRASAFLLETTSPAQGRLRGRTDADLVTRGRDRFYLQAASRGRLSVPFGPEGWPLEVRVARHLAGVRELLAASAGIAPDRAVVLDGLPTYEELVSGGLGRVLRPPPPPGGSQP